MRITDPKEELITAEYKEKLPSEPRFLQFLEFVLQRDVRSRPGLQQIITKFDEMFPEAADFPLPAAAVAPAAETAAAPSAETTSDLGLVVETKV
jgi:hypothetical protein